MALITFLFLIKKIMNEEALKLLERIAKNTDHKTSFQIIVSGNQSSLTLCLILKSN